MTKIKETTKNNFSLAVEKKSIEEGLTYLDSLSAVMEECDIEPVAISKLINRSLKDKLEKEAGDLNLLKHKREASPFLS